MNAAEKTALEIIRSIRPFGATMIENEPRHRWITSIWRTDTGAWEIHGTAGTRTYIFYSKRDAIRAYNREARNA